MFKLASLALRNLMRNRARTALTAGAIAFGLAVMMWFITFATGSYNDMTRKGVSQLAGHVVVQNPDYQTEREPTLLVRDSDAVAATLRETFPDATVTQRILMGGMLTSSSSSVAAGISGFEPEHEAQVSDLDDKLIEGEWLEPDDARGIVIGAKMAEQLGVELGDKIVYMGQQKGQDEMQSRLFRVRGVFKTGSNEMDGFLAVVHLDAARALLTVDDGANQVAVHLPSAKQSLAASTTAADALKRDDLSVLNWKEALPELFSMIEVDKQSNDLIMIILGFIVALGVLNTVLMSVLERTREFGVLMAVGMSKRSVAGLVLLEGALLGVLGAIAGFAFGLIPCWLTVTYGIDVAALTGMENMSTGGIALDTMIYGAWDWPRLAKYVLAAVFFTILAAAWPAWRVTRLQPVDAMRHH